MKQSNLSSNTMKDKRWKNNNKSDGRPQSVTFDSEKSELDAAVVPLLALFRFASRKDTVLMLVGLAASIANGVCFPIMIIFFSEITEVFVTSGLNETIVYNMSCAINSTAISSNFSEGDFFVS